MPAAGRRREPTEVLVIRTRFAVALLASAFVLPASSASAGTLSGTVVIDGKPAAAAVVSAIPFEEPLEKARRQARGEAEPKVLASATAGPDGTFALTVPAVPGKEVLFRVRLAAKGRRRGRALRRLRRFRDGGPWRAAAPEGRGDRGASDRAGRNAGRRGARHADGAGALRRLVRPGPVPQEATTGADGSVPVRGRGVRAERARRRGRGPRDGARGRQRRGARRAGRSRSCRGRPSRGA